MFEKLDNKLHKRLGLQAIDTDTLRTGIITGYTVLDKPNGYLPYTVFYLVNFKNNQMLYVKENHLVILK